MIPSSSDSRGPDPESTVVDPDIVLISDFLSRELSLVEMSRVEERLRTDASFREKVQAMLDVDALPHVFSGSFGVGAAGPLPSVASEKEIAAGWLRFEQSRVESAADHVRSEQVIATIGRATTRASRRGWRIAAGVALLLAAGGFATTSTELLYGMEGPASENVADKFFAIFNRTTITSGESETRRFDLTNGSVATLLPSSRLVFRVGRPHEGNPLAGLVMTLRGEAILEVSPQSGNVYLGTQQARTTLTPGRYKVRAMRDEANMLVAVESGSITISPRGSDKTEQVVAGQSAQVLQSEITLASSKVFILPDSGVNSRTFPIEQQGNERLSIVQDLVIDGSKAGIEWGNERFRVSGGHSIAIAPVLGDRVVVVSADGKRIQTLAPRGNGPGEFNTAQFVGWMGNTDSLYVASGRRTIIYGPDMKFAREFVQPAGLYGEMPIWTAPPPGYLPVDGMFTDGNMLLKAGLALPPSVNISLGMQVNGIVAPDGKVVHLFSPTPDYLSKCSGRTTAPNGQALSFIKLLCVYPSSSFSTASKSLLIAPTGDPAGSSYQIIKLGMNGDTIFNKLFPFTPLAVTQREIDSVADERAADPPPRDPKEITHLIDSVRRRQGLGFHTPVLQVVAGIDGTAWVELKTRETGHLWMILDQAGVPIGRVLFPANVRIREATRSVAWGFERGTGTEVKIVRFKVGKN